MPMYGGGTEIFMNLPESVNFAIERLNAAGYEAYPVGGCVRDFLLGKDCADFDITTSALPEETRAVFSDFPVIETGIRHGTVTVVLDFPLEITTFRIDRGYTDGRHPDAVEFTRSLRDDLARRDFTVNAMAWGDGVIDPFGGRADLEGRVIRCVGTPETRFLEDALRILRGLRFAATLGFAVEEETARAMVSCKETLRQVSVERITEEVKKLVLGEFAAEITRSFLEVLRAVLPDLRPNFETLKTLPKVLPLRLAAFLGSPAAVGYLRLSNKEREETLALISSQVPCDEARTLRAYGEEKARLVYAYHGLPFTMPDGIWRISDLAVGGADLLALGITGAEIGRILDALLTAVMEEGLPNEKNALLDRVRECMVK